MYMQNYQSLNNLSGTINSEINPLLTVHLNKTFVQDNNLTFVLTSAEILNIIDNVIEGVKQGVSKEEIVDQIDLLLDKESIKAIKEAREELEKGNNNSYTIEDFKKKFNLQ